MEQLQVSVKTMPDTRIRVEDLELSTYVLSVVVGDGEPQYQINYFHNGVRQTVYLRGHEFSVLD